MSKAVFSYLIDPEEKCSLNDGEKLNFATISGILLCYLIILMIIHAANQTFLILF